MSNYQNLVERTINQFLKKPSKIYDSKEEMIADINKDLDEGGVITNRSGYILDSNNHLKSLTTDLIRVKSQELAPSEIKDDPVPFYYQNVYDFDEMTLRQYAIHSPVFDKMNIKSGGAIPINLTSNQKAFSVK